MKADLFLGSSIYKIEFERTIFSHYNYINCFGLKVFNAIEYDDFEIKTNRRIKNGIENKSSIFIVCENKMIIYDEMSYIIEERFSENENNFEYVFRLNYPKIYNGFEFTKDEIDLKTKELLKCYLVKKRLEQNKI